MASDIIEARQARRRKRSSAGGIDEVREHLWSAVEVASQIVNNPEETTDRRLKAVYATAQASLSYLKIVDATEFEARLKRLENEVMS